MKSIFILLLSILIIVTIFLFVFIIKKKTHLKSSITRKMIHISMGPIFVFTWLFYSQDDKYIRYYATLFPLLASVVLFLSYVFPTSFLSSFLRETMSRENKVKELLQGPFIYAIIIGIITIIYWKETPHGILSIIILCFGDGMADVIGSRGSHVITSPFGRKTIEGCISFIIFGIIGCILYEYVFFQQIWFLQTVIIVLIGCFTEFLSPSTLDNLLIVTSTIIVSHFFSW